MLEIKDKRPVVNKTTASKTTANKTWDTKYGRRRVKFDPPTIQDAISAARDMTDDPQSQIEIAASLMGVAPEEVRVEALKFRPEKTTRVISTSRNKLQRAVIVERKVARRPVSGLRFRP